MRKYLKQIIPYQQVTSLYILTLLILFQSVLFGILGYSHYWNMLHVLNICALGVLGISAHKKREVVSISPAWNSIAALIILVSIGTTFSVEITHQGFVSQESNSLLASIQLVVQQLFQLGVLLYALCIQIITAAVLCFSVIQVVRKQKSTYELLEEKVTKKEYTVLCFLIVGTILCGVFELLEPITLVGLGIAILSISERVGQTQ